MLCERFRRKKNNVNIGTDNSTNGNMGFALVGQALHA